MTTWRNFTRREKFNVSVLAVLFIIILILGYKLMIGPFWS